MKVMRIWANYENMSHWQGYKNMDFIYLYDVHAYEWLLCMGHVIFTKDTVKCDCSTKDGVSETFMGIEPSRHMRGESYISVKGSM